MARISNQNIAIAIHKSLKDKVGTHYRESLTDVVNFLVRRRLLSQAPDILRRLQDLVDLEEKALRVKVSGARSLGTHLKHDLAKILERRYKAKEIIFDESVDANFLGGFKLEVNDEVIDLTLKNKIRKLAEYLK